MKKTLFLLILLATLTGCSSLRGDGDAYRPGEPLSVTARLSASFHIADNEKGVGGMLRMRRDQIIILSFTKFGIEGARVIFRPDSVLVLDRLHKRYATMEYAQIGRLFSTASPLDFGKIQTFFWNDGHRSVETAELSLSSLFPVEMHIERKDFSRIRQHKIPRQTRLLVNIFDEKLRFDLKLSNIKINYGWNAAPTIPDGYTAIDPKLLETILFKSITKP